ncbi:MAG: hypothetical protein GEV00_21825 [Actinophytocola sp.]|nr:hypothetical protein [Actinophytocola sp.]
MTLRFHDGSVGTVAYVTGGSGRFQKETLDASGGGRTARLDDFRRATLWTGRRRDVTRARGRQDKGQREELQRFLAAVRTGGPMPVPLDDLVAVTRATLVAELSLATGRAEPV